MSSPAAAPRLAATLPPVYAAALLRMAMPFLVLPVLAARVGSDEFGRLGFILVWASLLSTLVEGGFLAAATRLAVAADPGRRYALARQIFSARVVLSLPAVAAAFVAARWAEPAGEHALVDAGAIAVLACALGWPATWYLQATQQLHRWSRIELAVYGLLIAGCWFFVHSVEAYVALQFAASAALALFGWRWLLHDLAHERAGAMLWSAAAVRPGLALGARMLPVSVAGAAYSVALPAAASAQLARADLGVYFLADRLVRAVLAAADPVHAVVYPKMVALMGPGARAGAALRYAARWAAAASVVGAALYAAMALAWDVVSPYVTARDGGIDPARLRETLLVLGLVWPLLFGWKFLGYWMLGSGRHDHAYRTCVIAGGVAGVAGAATVGGAHGALGLAWTAIAVELLVIAVAVAMMAAGRRGARR